MNPALLSPIARVYLAAAKSAPVLFLPWAFAADRAAFKIVNSLVRLGLLAVTMSAEQCFVVTTEAGARELTNSACVLISGGRRER